MSVRRQRRTVQKRAERRAYGRYPGHDIRRKKRMSFQVEDLGKNMVKLTIEATAED